MASVYGERWEVVKSLPEGGQAHVFLVKDLRGGGETRYVLKRLKNINRIERFKREIEAIRNLQHENIVRSIDFNLGEGKPYFVTEFCEGGSLAEGEPFWRGFPLRALELFRQICEGVAHAHRQGIIHRDLKPENIFLRTKEGPAVVGDFGICFVEDDGTRVTLIEEAVGSRLFIAPELEDGRVLEVSSKADTYSLGKLLYWLMSGGRVFSRERHRERDWDLKGYNHAAPSWWNNIYLEHVNRLLDFMIRPDPGERIVADNVLTELAKVTRWVSKEFTPISKEIKQPCVYCGYGHYVLQAKGAQVRNFGFTPVGNPDWRILTCDACGHVQAFRVDQAQRQDWWS